MFRKPLALKVAGLLGMGAGIFYVAFAFDFATQMHALNPFGERDWLAAIEEVANNAGPQMLTQVMGFLAAVLLGFFVAALTVQADKSHPSLATMGGISLGAAAGMLALRAIWIAFVQIPMAITYHGHTDQAFRQELLLHFRLDVFPNLFFAWGYIFFAALGLFLTGLALTPVKEFFRLLPVSFLVASVACASFIPALAYVGNQTFMAREFDRELASGFLFSAWLFPGLAFLLGGAWLLRTAMRTEMPQEEIIDIHLERAA